VPGLRPLTHYTGDPRAVRDVQLMEKPYHVKIPFTLLAEELDTPLHGVVYLLQTLKAFPLTLDLSGVKADNVKEESRVDIPTDHVG